MSPAEYLGLFGFKMELRDSPAAANAPNEEPPIISKIDEMLRPVRISSSVMMTKLQITAMPPPSITNILHLF